MCGIRKSENDWHSNEVWITHNEGWGQCPSPCLLRGQGSVSPLWGESKPPPLGVDSLLSDFEFPTQPHISFELPAQPGSHSTDVVSEVCALWCSRPGCTVHAGRVHHKRPGKNVGSSPHYFGRWLGPEA